MLNVMSDRMKDISLKTGHQFGSKAEWGTYGRETQRWVLYVRVCVKLRAENCAHKLVVSAVRGGIHTEHVCMCNRMGVI